MDIESGSKGGAGEAARRKSKRPLLKFPLPREGPGRAGPRRGGEWSEGSVQGPGAWGQGRRDPPASKALCDLHPPTAVRTQGGERRQVCDRNKTTLLFRIKDAL